MNVDPFWLALIGKIAGGLTGFAVVNRYVIKPFRKNVIAKVVAFYEKVNFIQGELKPNGGGSLRDAVDRTQLIITRVDQRQRNYFQFDPHGIFEMDATGNLIWVNRAYLDMVHRHPDDILGTGWRSCISEHDRARVIAEWESAVRDKRDFLVKMLMVDMDGVEVPVEARALRMLDSKSNLIGHIGFMVRTDVPPPGCRWCRTLEDLFHENIGLREHLSGILRGEIQISDRSAKMLKDVIGTQLVPPAKKKNV